MLFNICVKEGLDYLEYLDNVIEFEIVVTVVQSYALYSYFYLYTQI